MKENWDRAHPILDLRLDTLTDLVQPAFPGRTVVAAEVMTAGLANTNYKIALSGRDEPVVVRVYTRDRTACRKEAEIQHLIRDTVPIPEILHADVEGERYEWPYTVTAWVDGVMLRHVLAQGDGTAIRSAAHAIGVALAAIGSYTFARAGFFGPCLVVDQPMGQASAAWLSYMNAFLFHEGAGDRLGVALRDRVWRMAETGVHYVRAIDDARSLVHSDFNASNLLLRETHGAWTVAAVLDWEFAFVGSPLGDVGNMLRGDEVLSPVFEPAFIEGFVQGGGTLPPDWKRIATLLDLLALCAFLTAPDVSGRRIADVTHLVEATVRQWDTGR